jgi:hypothetical protein
VSSLTWGRKQIQFPKCCVFSFVFRKIRTMDKARKPNISVCYTPSSEPYSIYSQYASSSQGSQFQIPSYHALMNYWEWPCRVNLIHLMKNWLHLQGTSYFICWQWCASKVTILILYKIIYSIIRLNQHHPLQNNIPLLQHTWPSELSMPHSRIGSQILLGSWWRHLHPSECCQVFDNDNHWLSIYFGNK